jgi:hypothetical protein
MSTPTMDDAAKVLADPTAYADDDRLHAALTHLRANSPVAWVDDRPYRPSWVITKHADILPIERDNELFIGEPRPLLTTAEGDDIAKAQLGGHALRRQTPRPLTRMRLRHRDRGTPEEQLEVLLDFFRYFAALTASPRERPTDDLASAIANGRIDGEPLSDVDTASHYNLPIRYSLR